jgi:predicted O-linked N-acetylglucosamine transferase (SPINDLY family)
MDPQIQTMFHKALQDFQLGHLKEAEEILRHCAQLNAKIFDVIHLLAVVYASQEKHQTAIEYYKKALELSPNNVLALSNLGSSLNSIGHNQEAFSAFQKAIKVDPNEPIAWYNAANTLCDIGDYEESLIYYERSIKLNPQYCPALINYGKALFELKRYSESLTFYDEALKVNQDSLDCLINKGATLKELSRYDEAIAHYDKVLSLKPDYAEGLSNKGVALNGLKRYDEAIAHFDKALTLKPDYAEGYCNKGVVIYELKRYDEAIAHFDKALTLKPDYAEGYYNKGNALNELKRYDEGIAHLNKALSLKPNMDGISGDLLKTKMKICSWSGFTESLADISKKVVSSKKAIDPFSLLALNDDSVLQKKCSEIFIQSLYSFNPVLGPILKLPKKEKIRIAYLSPDFRNHPVSVLTSELFEIHNKNRFEILAFSLQKAPIGDEINVRLRKCFDRFIDVDGMSDREIAQLAREFQIDIAIDLAGPTQYSRTGVFSYRAAPIQVNWLGYPGTLGANYMDYIIADKTLISPELQSCYSEKVVYLPNSYQVNDRKRLISGRKFTRQELGLPDHGFVFCCFNNNFKILPATFDGWMRILKAVEGSVFWLLQDNPLVVDNLKCEALNYGVEPSRLIFAERMPLPDHLARHRQADLFLDTLPYNAHTTSSDALWTGLPVLTLIGQSFASRVAASLLNAIGLPELITSTQDEYEALAIELALNSNKLADIKLKLANNRLSAPLFDTPLFTKNLEAAYIQMYERYQNGLEPAHFSVVSDTNHLLSTQSAK